MSEIAALRTRKAKHFDLGSGRKAAEIHAGDLHYLGQDDQWHDAENVLEDQGGGICQTLEKTVQFGMDGDKLIVTKDGRSLDWTPKELGLYDPINNKYRTVERANNVTPVISGNVVTLPGLFDGFDMEITFHPQRTTKRFIVQSRPTLDDPASFGADPASTYLVIDYAQGNPQGLDFIVDSTGLPIEDATPVHSDLLIEYQGEEVLRLLAGSMAGATGRTAPVSYIVGGRVTFAEGAPYSSIMAATYPIWIDPNTTIYGGNEDGWGEDGTSVDTSSTANGCGRVTDGKSGWYTDRVYFRFDLASLSGYTCDSADLQLRLTTKAGSSWSVIPKIYTTDWGPTLTTGDWGQAGTDQPSKAVADITASAYNDFGLTASDVENKFGGVISFEVRGSVESGSSEKNIFVRMAESATDPRIYIEYTEAGTTYNESATDGMKLGETLANTLDAAGAASDGLDMGESLTSQMDAVGGASDGLDMGESLSGELEMDVAAADGVDLGDESSGNFDFEDSAEDGLSLGEATTGNLEINAEAVDGLGMGDVPSGLADMVAAVSDGGVLGDGATNVIEMTVAILDGLDLGDSSIGNIAFDESAADGLTLGEAVQAVIELLEDGVDGLDLGDSAVNALTIAQAVSDGLSLGDSAVSEIEVSEFFEAVSDAMNMGDSAAVALVLVPLVADGLELGDAASALLMAAGEASDGLTMSDESLAELIAFQQITDGMVLSESTVANVDKVVSAADGVLLGDSTSYDLTRLGVASDAVDLGDSAAPQVDFGPAAGDGVELGDTATAIGDLEAVAEDGMILSDAAGGSLVMLVAATDGLAMGDSAVSAAYVMAVLLGALVVSQALMGRIRTEEALGMGAEIERSIDGGVTSDSSLLGRPHLIKKG